MGVYAGDARSFAGKCFSVPWANVIHAKSGFLLISRVSGKKVEKPEKRRFFGGYLETPKVQNSRGPLCHCPDSAGGLNFVFP